MEYTRFGDGWVKRESPESEWEPVDRKDVPDNEIARAVMPDFRREQLARGEHPDGGQQFAKFV